MLGALSAARKKKRSNQVLRFACKQERNLAESARPGSGESSHRIAMLALRGPGGMLYGLVPLGGRQSLNQTYGWGTESGDAFGSGTVRPCCVQMPARARALARALSHTAPFPGI